MECHKAGAVPRARCRGIGSHRSAARRTAGVFARTGPVLVATIPRLQRGTRLRTLNALRFERQSNMLLHPASAANGRRQFESTAFGARG